MTFSTRFHHRVLRISLTGELDMNTAEVATDGFSSVPPAGPTFRRRRGLDTVLLDLSALSFMDSAGVTALADSRAMLIQDGWQVRLTAPPARVRRVLDYAVLAGWIPAYQHGAHVEGAQPSAGLGAGTSWSGSGA